MVEALKPLWRAWKLAYYRRALREIDPMHPDVGYIVHKLIALED